jgi:energy-coupling factor transporter ATP-binding protein EcfA2
MTTQPSGPTSFTSSTTATSPGCIVVVSGPLGAGKSTVARALLPLLSPPTSYIEGDRFWAFFASPPARPSPKTGSLLIRSAVVAALPFANSGYTAIVDFTIGPWHFPSILPRVRELPLHYFVLCPSLAVCAERTKGRAEGRVDDYAQYADLHAAYCDLGVYEKHAIRIDDASPEQLARLIADALHSGTHRLHTSQPL